MRLFLIAGILALLPACETTSSLEKRFPVGEAVSNPFLVGGKQIPLPPGRWVIRGRALPKTSRGTQGIQLILVNNVADDPRMAIWVATNLVPSSGFNGWNISRFCARNDLAHRVTEISVQGGDQRCWWVTHARMTRRQKSSPATIQTLDWAKSHGRVVPVNTVYVGYRFANTYDVLTVRYFFNPEAKGIAPTSRATWSTSDWHIDRILAFPKKGAFVDGLKEWGADWMPKIEAGFNGKLAATKR